MKDFPIKAFDTQLPAVGMICTNIPATEVWVASFLGWEGQPPEIQAGYTADGNGFVASLRIRSRPIISAGKIVLLKEP